MYLPCPNNNANTKALQWGHVMNAMFLNKFLTKNKKLFYVKWKVFVFFASGFPFSIVFTQLWGEEKHSNYNLVKWNCIINQASMKAFAWCQKELFKFKRILSKTIFTHVNYRQIYLTISRFFQFSVTLFCLAIAELGISYKPVQRALVYNSTRSCGSSTWVHIIMFRAHCCTWHKMMRYLNETVNSACIMKSQIDCLLFCIAWPRSLSEVETWKLDHSSLWTCKKHFQRRPTRLKGI